ncbi:hypothetical protein [Sandarakinorhabdus oryzae]|uniref:hypothetical protein n=1 Tax=Sandarakinorhabdus oryzae TaxID=2675220 RepID=UPI0018CC66C0|nr:hypothetical protein [Sandarakinorhabdus oryzae]
MNSNIMSAVFDTQSEAEHAVTQLRAAGIADAAISLHSQQDGKSSSTDGDGKDSSGDFVGKAALGAGVGTAIGIAALVIPGVGPLVAAGAIAAAAIPAAAVTGAAAGLAAGSLASVFSDRGIGEDDAAYYEQRMGDGGVLVTVDGSDAVGQSVNVQEILYRSGGHSRSQSKMNPAM